ncbi:hypothetical protein [Pseudobutyrivibrio sp.]|uniref:hypothetical protein n=1 Tax=Pseudobutyrivibrio sp. TaxID=2014367 RepID=UPI001D324F51|nr:hypothetical protein [Pseudobutyrivibrio sp.]MBE5912000.1 hypothetical protein [Pseudobutyrivibrio sp.]
MIRFNSRVRGAFFMMGIVFIVLGVIIGFIIAGMVGYVYEEITYEKSFGVMFGVFFGVFGINAFIGAMLIAVSEVLEGLEGICNNIANLQTDSSASVLGYSNNQSSSGFNSAEALSKLSAVASGNKYTGGSAGGWVCPSCGKHNKSFDEVCSCGERKDGRKESGTKKESGWGADWS